LSLAREYIKTSFGAEFLPKETRFYKTKSKLAQEAHEAIRPTKVQITKDQVQMSADHKKLYDLVWKRFVACQMTEAIYDQISMDVIAKGVVNSYTFRAAGSIIKFPGWQKVYGKQEDDEEKRVPLLKIGDQLDLLKLLPNQHFTQPPPRYTEASLIKTLEELGIGRPSTYAPTISTILDRHYVEREERKFRPTPLGAAVTDFLVKNFPEELEYGFTAKLEDELDDIANGELQWRVTIKNFFEPFSTHLDKVAKESDRVKVFAELTDEKCPEGHPLVIRYGRFGKFLACEKFPEHKFTKQFESEDFKAKREELEKLNLKCPQSGDPMVIRKNRRGRIFYGCSAYPKCKWASWQLPTAQPATNPN
jgi:DNA topoisomerase-1